MKIFFKVLNISIFIFFILFASTNISKALSSSTSLGVTLQVTSGPCNFNNLCEIDRAENLSNCPSDCGCNYDFVCSPLRGENISNCPNDCVCNNNNVCEPENGEDFSNCPSDCGVCNNNGVCEASYGEDLSNCPNDCHIQIADSGGGGSNFMGALLINSIFVKGWVDSANVVWQTTNPAKCNFSMGKTTDYEIETTAETNYFTNHIAQLNSINSPGIYYYGITCRDAQNQIAKSPSLSFSTIPLVGNVANFKATSDKDNIFLSWDNPDDDEFSSVKIVENESFYPVNVDNGKVVYNGTGTSFVGKEAKAGKIYYYAIYSQGKSGNFSSGSLASAALTDYRTTLPPIVLINPEPSKIDINNFSFYYNGNYISLEKGSILGAENDKSFIITIATEYVPAEYKTLIAGINIDGEQFDYAFKLNNEKTFYETNFIAPKKAGNYPLTLTFFDDKNNPVSQLIVRLLVSETIEGATITDSNNFDYKLVIGIVISLISILLVLWWIILKLIQKIRKRKLSVTNNKSV